ncbi:hypothetical protein [Variovorax sp. YR216]|uniref:hypothetical protein n=1 Tax=Variovorax sp. YR216 TaxID=1882828 RepID=UPI000894FA0A|nr:hypothetical protein [Variovorax sp. YR216]SEB15665.1 hypothetical protein SAMN05444680_11042 [Variovorax sp. YR216]
MTEILSTPLDRAAESVGNIVLLEHYNCVIDDQRLATLFYVTAMGGTRDPYLFTGLDNMWVNFGRTQVHMPSRGHPPVAQRLRGTAGFVVPDLAAMAARLDFVRAEMARVAPERGHLFDYQVGLDAIELRCPWGNRIRCHAPSARFGRMELGLSYIEFDVPPGTAAGIGRFYEQVMKTPVRLAQQGVEVMAGVSQSLRFTETERPLPDYDGHHFLIYLADFSGPYQWLKDRGLITKDVDPHEWRLEWICDPEDGRRLFQVEHEVRSMRHPLFNRPLVNRNPAITNIDYRRGNEAFAGDF